MAATAGHRLTLDPMGKYSNAFFSETTNMIKAKLYMNEEDLWNFSQSEHIIGPGSHIEYPTGTKNSNFVVKPNCTWMFIRWSSTNFRFFVPVWNSKWRLRQDLV
jgi:hypothetical protein